MELAYPMAVEDVKITFFVFDNDESAGTLCEIAFPNEIAKAKLVRIF